MKKKINDKWFANKLNKLLKKEGSMIKQAKKEIQAAVLYAYSNLILKHVNIKVKNLRKIVQ